MKPEPFETLSALIDGEMVEPESLAVDLAKPGATDFLIDCARLRLESRAIDVPRPSWAHETRHRLARRPPTWLAAAGIAAALLVGMLWLARPSTSVDAEVLPQPDRVLQFERGRDWSG